MIFLPCPRSSLSRASCPGYPTFFLLEQLPQGAREPAEHGQRQEWVVVRFLWAFDRDPDGR